MFIDQEKNFILDPRYMIDFNSVNIVIIYEIRWAERFYKKHVKTQIFIFLRGIAIDQSKIDKKKKNRNEEKFHEEEVVSSIKSSGKMLL